MLTGQGVGFVGHGHAVRAGAVRARGRAGGGGGPAARALRRVAGRVARAGGAVRLRPPPHGTVRNHFRLHFTCIFILQYLKIIIIIKSL